MSEQGAWKLEAVFGASLSRQTTHISLTANTEGLSLAWDGGVTSQNFHILLREETTKTSISNVVNFIRNTVSHGWG